MASEVGSLVPKAENGVMGPPAPRMAKRQREQTILDEDEWVDQIEAIIQRDYYPDLPKLESELEWLEVSLAIKEITLTVKICLTFSHLRLQQSGPRTHLPCLESRTTCSWSHRLRIKGLST